MSVVARLTAISRRELDDRALTPGEADELLTLIDAVENEHAILHPDGRQQMRDGSWQACEVCLALSRAGNGQS